MERGGTLRREGLFALLLAAIAGLRIGLFSLAFPFFSNVDEYRHLDVVIKYSRGYWPTPGPDSYEKELAWWIGMYGSPESQRVPEVADTTPVPAPSWTQPDELKAQRVARQVAYLTPRHSLEADQPPLYYASAGAWLALGRALGVEDLALLYWVRLMGVFVGVAGVLVSWRLLRAIYAEHSLVPLGVPALLAFLPLDSLYTVTSDVLSPLLGGLAFLLVVRLASRPNAAPAAFLLAGLAGAAGILSKYPNAVLGAAAFACTVVSLRLQPGDRRVARRWLLFWAAFLLPPLWWLLRIRLLGGELTETGIETFGARWDHPVSTPTGFASFVRQLLPTFWRGELMWETRTLAWPLADWVYQATSLVFLALAAVGLGFPSRPRPERLAEGAAVAALLASVAVLACMSMLFHFVEAGLISGVLVPFALLYVRGVEVATARVPEFWRATAGWAVLAAVGALALASELALTRPVFLSAYNAFHLP